MRRAPPGSRLALGLVSGRVPHPSAFEMWERAVAQVARRLMAGDLRPLAGPVCPRCHSEERVGLPGRPLSSRDEKSLFVFSLLIRQTGFAKLL
jgi:hypothetical protein